jgi:hypothetical protein
MPPKKPGPAKTPGLKVAWASFLICSLAAAAVSMLTPAAAYASCLMGFSLRMMPK